MSGPFGGRSLISCPEAYLKSFKSFISSFEPGNVTLNCIEEHVVPLIKDINLEDHSPLCILSVGSGDGVNADLPFIEMPCKAGQKEVDKRHFVERAIEPEKVQLEAFRAKAENLPESLKSRADIEFEWLPMTYQEYVEQKKTDDVKFDVVHFFHSIYHVELETALEHCYEKELGEKGVILCILTGYDGAYAKYGRAFSSQGLIQNPGAYRSNKEITDVAKKNRWKYVECSGENKNLDITAIFDSSSVDGNHLLDFITHWAHVRMTAGPENLQKILDFWANECFEDGHGRKLANFQLKTVVIFKGLGI